MLGNWGCSLLVTILDNLVLGYTAVVILEF